MRMSETHEVTISFGKDDDVIVRPQPSWDTYRGRHADVRVSEVTVDLLDGSVNAKGRVILANGGTSADGYMAELTLADEDTFRELAHQHVAQKAQS